MAVVINEFEAIAEPAADVRADGAPPKPPRRLKPADLVRPLRSLALRGARIRAH